MAIFVSEANKQGGSFLAVSSPLSLFQNEERGGNSKEAACLVQLASSTKVSHVTMVTMVVM